MDYWAKPGLDRQQALLFHPTLDECISLDHPVRLLDEILRSLDWSDWIQKYDGRRGQPPIPPRTMAALILYGLMRRIRSSRQLEYACGHNIDFMWLVEGRTVDHDTICRFRVRFKTPLVELFKKVGRVAMGMGFVRLLEVAFDGTRVKANASRHHTWTKERVEAVLAELEQQAGQMLADAETADARENTLGDERESSALPITQADIEKRKKMLEQVVAKLEAAEVSRKKNGYRTPSQLPKADTDSTVMPNKEGGYAPNYTPAVATDGAQGFIVDCDVIAGPNEQNELLNSVDRIEENFEKKPENLSADKAFGTGPNLAGMESRKVNFHTPVESPSPQPGNPALRADPRQPVPEAEWPNLPRTGKKKLAKCCFIYDEEADVYFCPMGQEMHYRDTKKSQAVQGQRVVRIYNCCGCANCPLAKECLDPRGKHGRTISRDAHELERERMYAKMQTEAAKEVYKRRMHIGETQFAIIKAIFGVRRFLLRGLEKVRTEWYWVCTAYNLKKLIRLVGALRAESVKVAGSVNG
jgi:transposase